MRKVVEQAGQLGLGVQVIGNGIAREQAPAAGYHGARGHGGGCALRSLTAAVRVPAESSSALVSKDLPQVG